MSDTQAAAKPCAVCGIDCTGRPRVKVQPDRYLCNDCYELARQTIQVQKNPQPFADGPAPAAIPELSEPEGFDPAADNSAVLSPASASTPRCPGCGRPLPAKFIVCVECGFDTETGKRLRMKVRRLRRSRELAEERHDPIAARRARHLGRLGALAGALIGIAQWIILASALDRARGLPIILLGALTGLGAAFGAGAGAGWRSSRTAGFVVIPAMVGGALLIATIYQSSLRAGAEGQPSLLAAVQASFRPLHLLWAVVAFLLARELAYKRPGLRKYP